MEEEKIENNKSKLLNDGMIIGLATILSYFLVFVYESSYLRYFNISSEFVSVSLEKFIIFIISISGFFLLLYLMIDLILFFIPKKENFVGRRIFTFIVIQTIIFLPILYINNFSIKWWGYSILGLIIYALFYFGFPLIHRNKKGYKDKLIEQQKIENYPSLLDRAGGLFGNKGGLFIVIFIYLIYISYILGSYNAKEQKEFIVASIDNNNFAVIREYGDNIILLKINQENKVFYNTFYIKDRDELSKLSLEKRETGQLIHNDK